MSYLETCERHATDPADYISMLAINVLQNFSHPKSHASHPVCYFKNGGLSSGDDSGIMRLQFIKKL